MTTAMTTPEPLVCVVLNPAGEKLYSIKDEQHSRPRAERLTEIHAEAVQHFGGDVTVVRVPPSWWPAEIV